MELLKEEYFQSLVLKARQTYGDEGQIDQFHEEIGELMVAVSHYKRGRIQKEEVLKEIADVEQLIMTLVIMLGLTPEEYEEVQLKALNDFAVNVKEKPRNYPKH